MERITEKTTLHFDLSFISDCADPKLHVGVARCPLKAHTAESLQQHRLKNSALNLIADEKITHYVEDLELPTEYVQLLLLTTPSKLENASLDTLLLSMVHVPRKAREARIQQQLSNAHPHISCPHSKLAMYGAEVSMGQDKSPIIDVHDYKTALDAAVSLVFHHVELVNIGATTAATVHSIIEYSNGISDLATHILEQVLAHQKDPANQNWVYETPYKNSDFTPSSKNYYDWSDVTREWVKPPMKDSLRLTKNDPSLKSSSTNAGVYTVQNGTTEISVPQSQSVSMQEQTDSSSAKYWTINNLTPHHGFEQTGALSFDNKTLSISFTNEWLRWLSGYVEFYGPDGAPVKPEGWVSQVPGELAGTYDTDTKKYVTIFSSVNTILAIPVGNTPTTFKFDWPSNASSVKFMAGGIGRTGGIEGQNGVYYGSWDPQVCTAGAIMTGVFNFSIPTVCMIAGASVSLSSLNQIAKSALEIILDVGSTLITGIASSSIQGGNTTTLMVAFADMIPRLLLDCGELAVWMAAHIAEGAAEEASPVLGWIALAVSVLSDVALLAETTVDVISSPATFELIASRAIDAQWTLLPDPNHQNTWPLEATHYKVVATFKDGTARSTIGEIKSSPQTGPITVNFNVQNRNRLPAGGDVMFTAKFYSDTGWLAGIAKTAYMSADVKGNLLTVPQMAIKENLVPLKSSTAYQFDKTLIYNEQTNKHEWSNASGAPTATIKDLNPGDVGNNLAQISNITVSQQTSKLGYTWQASGQDIPLDGKSGNYSGLMFTFQAIDDRATPDNGQMFVPEGFNSKPLLLFDIDGPASGVGNNFWLDPRDGLYHVRQVILDGSSHTFDLTAGKSWGRFNQQIDAAVIHPAGYIVGVHASHTSVKLESLRLGSAMVADADAPLANMYSGFGTREGLLQLPVGIAATPNSGVIVLEEADPQLHRPEARLQAFDLLGNPAPIFSGNTAIAALRQENVPVKLLDLAVESKGYIYVLKFLNDGSSVADYLLDIYNPDGTWLTQTGGISAGRINVDLWRTLYTLNFGIIAKPSGGRTEPSVSIWLPSTPTG